MASRIVLLAYLIALGSCADAVPPLDGASATGPVVFEGARLIVGRPQCGRRDRVPARGFEVLEEGEITAFRNLDACGIQHLFVDDALTSNVNLTVINSGAVPVRR